MSERIDTTGTSVKILPDGKLQIFLDKRVTPRAFSQVLEYLYTDRVSWDKDTDKGLISETKDVCTNLNNLMNILLQHFL